MLLTVGYRYTCTRHLYSVLTMTYKFDLHTDEPPHLEYAKEQAEDIIKVIENEISQRNACEHTASYIVAIMLGRLFSMIETHKIMDVIGDIDTLQQLDIKGTSKELKGEIYECLCFVIEKANEAYTESSPSHAQLEVIVSYPPPKEQMH